MSTLSYPKSKINVLLLEGIHSAAQHIFASQEMNTRLHKGSMTEDELIDAVRDVHILGIRSKTQISQRVLDAAPKLLTIGAFCIGTNQIDLDAAANRGIPVFNAPYSNTRSVVELALGQMIMLIRGVFDKSNQMHAGVWNKSASNSYELRGKVLGIVGYGNIGSQLSVLAEAIGMRVFFYDLVDKMPLGNAQRVNSLNELLSVSDVVSLHVDGRPSNEHMIDEPQIQIMKTGAILINLSRGHVVNLEALHSAMKSGHIAGASIDVFPVEPINNQDVFSSPLQGTPNLILTPHIGGSTLEAQQNIGTFVPNKLLEFINNGSTQGAVNFPEITLPKQSSSHRILHIHQNVPGILAQINHIFADQNINILGQYLKTQSNIGYVITDIDPTQSQYIRKPLKDIDGTIRYRELY